ncbi:hypothetical protein TrispH2_008777 [Trichoplax sp. H2]|nr:hypothetical protein TrispH2_008777 [Trichoplax sp. H2]|eukprot:RDD39490.1 hypothetical protein TrispH2_008777 [Trichoplax sp. H2]
MGYIITQNEVDEIQSLKAGRNVCKKYGISTKGLKTVQDFKERLDLLRRNETIENYQRSASSQRIKSAIDKFKETRIQIIDLLQRASQFIFLELEPELVEIVKTFDEQYLDNMNKHIKQLHCMECPILVAGEVSAGKSSLINLILGQSVLPVGHLHTTTCICELRYSTNPCLKSFIWNASEKKLEPHEETPINGTSDLMTEIQKVMHLTSKKKDSKDSLRSSQGFAGLDGNSTNDEELALLSTSIDDVHVECNNFEDLKLSNGKLEICWEFDFLKDGVFLVDSPGIGETALATEQIVCYLPKVSSIIYVINAENAGGIQEDRLVRLLIEEQNMEREKFKTFTPESAIFICNKWDSIPKTDRDTVENSIKQKLRRIWPGFHDSQLILLSSTNAANHFKAGFVSDDLRVLHSLIAHLIEESLKKKVVDYTSWLHTLLGIVANRYRLLTNCSFLEGDIRSSYLSNLRNNIALARSTIGDQNFHDNIEKIIDNGTAEITVSLLQFLKSNRFEVGMTKWHLDDIPIREKVTDIEEVITNLFDDRFISLLTFWEEDNGLLRRFYNKIRESVNLHYSRILKVLEGLENALQIADADLNDLRDLHVNSSPKTSKSWRNFYAGVGIVTGTIGGSAAGAAIGLTIAEGVGAAVIGGVIGGVTGGIGIVISIVVIAVLARYMWSKTGISRQRRKILIAIQQSVPNVVSELATGDRAKEIAKAYTNPIKESIKHTRMQVIKQLKANEVLLNEANQIDYSTMRSAAMDKIELISKLRNGINNVLKSYDCGI